MHVLLDRLAQSGQAHVHRNPLGRCRAFLVEGLQVTFDNCTHAIVDFAIYSFTDFEF